MRKLLSSFLHVQDVVSEWSGRVISWMLIGMVGVLIYEVILRYFFNAPTTWAQEASTMLYGSFCILAGAYTLLHKGHVRMDIVYRLLPERTRAGLDSFTGLLTIGFLGLFLWVSIKAAAASWIAHEFSGGSLWAPPLYPFKTAIALAALLLLLQTIVTFIRDLSVSLRLKLLNRSGSDARH